MGNADTSTRHYSTAHDSVVRTNVGFQIDARREHLQQRSRPAVGKIMVEATTIKMERRTIQAPTRSPGQYSRASDGPVPFLSS